MPSVELTDREKEEVLCMLFSGKYTNRDICIYMSSRILDDQDLPEEGKQLFLDGFAYGIRMHHSIMNYLLTKKNK